MSVSHSDAVRWLAEWQQFVIQEDDAQEPWVWYDFTGIEPIERGSFVTFDDAVFHAVKSFLALKDQP